MQEGMACGGPIKPDFYRVELQNTRWEVPSRYQELRAIGIGTYGSVCSALDSELGIRVAVKKLSRPFQSVVHAKRAYRELKLLKHMNHENVIKLLNVFTPAENFADFKDVYLVTELMCSDLGRVAKAQQLTDGQIQFFIYQILRGLKYIHSADIIHRDLKPNNIGVNDNYEIKILDFGLGRQIGDQMTGYIMTRYWRAPEIIFNWRHYGHKVDIWSVGCVLAELLTGQILFPADNFKEHLIHIIQLCGTPDQELMDKIESEPARYYVQTLPPFPKKDFEQYFIGSNPLAIELLTQLLVMDPDRRLSAEQALSHKYLSRYHLPENEPVCEEKYDSSFEELTKGTHEWKALTFEEIENFMSPPIPRPTTHPTLANYDCSQLSQSDTSESPSTANEQNPTTPSPTTANEQNLTTPSPTTANEQNPTTPSPTTANEQNLTTPSPTTANEQNPTTPSPTTPSSD